MTASKRKRKNHVEEFDPQRVRPLPGQPRQRFRGIRELADSIAEIGQQTPGLVTPVEDDPKFDVQLVDGERRLRACKLLGRPFRAELRDAADLEEIFAASFASNFGRQDHDVVEIAEALDRMQRAGRTIEAIGRIAGRSVAWVISHLNLLKLHPDVRAMMVRPEDASEDESPRISFTTAQLLVPLPHEKQVETAAMIAGRGMGIAEARRFVLKKRRAMGDRHAYAVHRHHGKRRALLTVRSVVTDMRHKVGVYLDMKSADVAALIAAMSPTDASNLIDEIEAGEQDLAMLRETVQEVMKKGRAAA